jgi:hypothetical protein
VTSSLALEAGARSGSDTGNTRRPRREYLDFIVDGESLGVKLASILGGANLPADRVPVLVLDWPIGFPAEDYGRLAGELPASLPDGRVPLYICPECGDLGCGGVTAVVERTADTVVWREFGYQNDYEPFDQDEVLKDVGPFVSELKAYQDVLLRFRDRWPLKSPK